MQMGPAFVLHCCGRVGQPQREWQAWLISKKSYHPLDLQGLTLDPPGTLSRAGGWGALFPGP